MKQDAPESFAAAFPRRRDPAGAALGLFSSVWLGITWAALLFVYCSIGSAVPAVRQHPWLEMTEFEWFHWWPFNVLIVLLCTTLIVVTLRRIPLRPVNFGVWMIHAGIIVLCVGSFYYFSTKVEGDTPAYRRQVRILLPGLAQPTTLVALPGNDARVSVGPDVWRLAIQSTQTDWPILSEEHKGEKAYAVNVQVTPPTGEPFVRQLLSGYPQYTEDVLPGKGRAVKALGRKLVDENLVLSLEPAPQEYFHLQNTWALFVRKLGEREWIERPIDGLPRYNDRIGSRDQVFTDPHHPIPPRPIDLLVPPPPGGDALGSAEVRVSGFLRYAHLQRQWRDGGSQLNPVLHVSVLPDHAAPQTHELTAFDREHDRAADGLIEFRWLEEFGLVDSLPTDARAVVRISVPGTSTALDVPLSDETVVGSEGSFTPIVGTDFAYRVLNVQDNLVLPAGRGSISVAMVEIQMPDAQFTRMVADRPDMTRDMKDKARDPHALAGKPEKPDPRIEMTYQPGSAPITFAAHPKGLFLSVNGPQGRILGRDVQVAETVEVVPGLRVRADEMWRNAVAEVKPFVVPPSRRERDANETFAMIRLEVGAGREVQTRWVRFNQYALPDEGYSYDGRFSYTPERFRMPDGNLVELLFARQRMKLPAPVALEEFALDTHLGGYTGQALTIRNYVSKLRFWDGTRWTDSRECKVNAPAEFGGFWFFQSMWDKPPSGNPGGGMNYTGLGVGNRRGVHVQLAGCCLSVIGMLYAFYVKPVLKRRRYQQSRAKVTGRSEEEPAAVESPTFVEAVEV